jgi:hypothetical protein
VPGRPREFDSSLCFLDISPSKSLDYDDTVLSLRDDQVSSGITRNGFNLRLVYICMLSHIASNNRQFLGCCDLASGTFNCGGQEVEAVARKGETTTSTNPAAAWVASVPVPCSRSSRLPRCPGEAKTHEGRPGK